jgi:hypothetical protein
VFDVHPEGYKEVDDHGRTQGHKGHIDKILTDGGCGNTHLFSYSGTYSKYMPFNKMFEAVHSAKLKTFSPKTKALKNASISVNLQHPI